MSYSIPAACQEPACDHSLIQDYKFWRCFTCGEMSEAYRLRYEQRIPATAKAIMDLDRKPQLTPAQQQQGESIQRAVDALSRNSLMNSYRRGEG